MRIVSCSPLETEQLGYRLGLILKPGSFLALRGGLGGGKTCFTRGVVSAVAPVSAHMVASPTFAIMNSYPGQVPVYHFDFYRLSGDDDIVELGFDEYFHGKGVSVVEWSERLESLLPDDHLVVEFGYLEDDRRLITITANGPVSSDILELLNEVRLKENFL
ncbi:MAG: tRNA (adenosine(37)-N6)-threonylcarbamoyltransferase complex ATPase subunit type 1 TsaE [Deltaproteobacteria bacterium]|nr:tRNA (adenosine(37)-N6)-threonylcarbamoyltransferase complex ATPase subunit type 1 TsaE [Deltaproteobacteria bacterium]